MAREGNVQSKEHNLASGGFLFGMGIATPSRGWYSGGLRIVTGWPDGAFKERISWSKSCCGWGSRFRRQFVGFGKLWSVQGLSVSYGVGSGMRSLLMCGGKRRCVRFGVPSNEQPEGEEYDEEGNVLDDYNRLKLVPDPNDT